MTYYYDDAWRIEEEAVEYQIDLAVSPEWRDAGVIYHISAVARHKDGTEIFSLNTATYEPYEGEKV